MLVPRRGRRCTRDLSSKINNLSIGCPRQYKTGSYENGLRLCLFRRCCGSRVWGMPLFLIGNRPPVSILTLQLRSFVSAEWRATPAVPSKVPFGSVLGTS